LIFTWFPLSLFFFLIFFHSNNLLFACAHDEKLLIDYLNYIMNIQIIEKATPC
jgi:hypothetical protein